MRTSWCGTTRCLLPVDLTNQSTCLRHTDVSKKDQHGYTPLIYAARSNYVKIVAALVEAKADVHASNKDGWTALMKAIAKGNVEVTTMLRAAGSELTGKDRAALDRAKEKEELAKEAVARKEFQLISAALDGNSKQVKQLLARGANVNFVRRGDRSNALGEAAGAGHASIVHQLILAGANLTAFAAGAAAKARGNNHVDLAAQVENVSPRHFSMSKETSQIVARAPLSARLLAAGIPLQSLPQPAYHTIVYSDTLLLTEIGPWLRAVAIPESRNNEVIKNMVFALISHTYSLTHDNPGVAEQFFQEFLVPPAQSYQAQMPDYLHAMAVELGVDAALAPPSLLELAADQSKANQGQYLAFMKPEHLNVAESILGSCSEKFAGMQKEAEIAVANVTHQDRASTLKLFVNAHLRLAGAGTSQRYANAHAHSLPTVPEVIIAALCLVSTFIYSHLQTTHPELFLDQNFPAKASPGLIRWPAVKNMLRMLAKIQEDYADLDLPWNALLDTVRFSLVSETTEKQAAFVEQFLPDCVAAKTGIQAPKKRRVDPDAPNHHITAVRAKSTMCDPQATVKQELWNLVYKPAGLTFSSMLGEGGLTEIEGTDRWKEFGDVEWRAGRDPRNTITALRPSNPTFLAALATAKKANPTISAYVWEPALQLLAHPTFATEPVAIVIEVQLYLEPFLRARKAVHGFYKITRAPNLALLAQDCRGYAINPDIAYDQQKQVTFDSAKHAETEGGAVAAKGGRDAKKSPAKAKAAQVRVR